MSEEVKLLGAWASPFVLRARIALNIKSVRYEYIEEPMGEKSELLLQSNPVHKKIPVLIHNGNPICESLIIVEYVDQVWSSSGPSILPSHPYDRAIARFWAAFTDEKVYPVLKAINIGPIPEEERLGLIEQLKEALVLLDDAYSNISLSKGNPFFGGNRVGFLDIAVGGSLAWLRVTEAAFGVKLVDPSITPGLAQWAQRFSAEDVVKHVVPDTGKLLEVAKVLRAALSAAAAQDQE